MKPPVTTSAHPGPTDTSPTPAPVAAIPQATPELQRLLATLVGERAAMKRALSVRPCNAADQKQARQALLISLEAYALGLSKRHLPVPPRLRDELFLQRQLATA
jgi:hypothetical protein